MKTAGIGTFHLQAFKSGGSAQVIVIGLERDARRFEIAKQLGADHIGNGSREDTVERVRDLTNGPGVDIVVETANHPSTAFPDAPSARGSNRRISVAFRRTG